MLNKQAVAFMTTLAAVVGLLTVCVEHGCALGGKEKKSAHGPLKENEAVTLPGPGGKFDWMTVDSKRRRLLAAHTEAGMLEVFDLTKEESIASIKTGACQGVAVGEKLYFVGDAAEHKLVILDAESLEIEGQVNLPGPVDAIAYDSRNHKVYAGHDEGADVWVINPSTRRSLGAISVHGVPEYIEFDRQSNSLYQNVKTTNTVEVISAESGKIVSSWSTSPAQRPHGLAVDAKKKCVYSAGANGILVSIDMKSGKVNSIVSIGKDVDQIAFDADKHRIYCACSETISVIDASETELKLIDNVPCHAQAHSLSIDPKSHAVWISYSDEKNSYLQKFDFLD